MAASPTYLDEGSHANYSNEGSLIAMWLGAGFGRGEALESQQSHASHPSRVGSCEGHPRFG